MVVTLPEFGSFRCVDGSKTDLHRILGLFPCELHQRPSESWGKREERVRERRMREAAIERRARARIQTR